MVTEAKFVGTPSIKPEEFVGSRAVGISVFQQCLWEMLWWLLEQLEGTPSVFIGGV